MPRHLPAACRRSKCARVGGMAIPVLVIGADPELAALIRRTLEAEHGCHVVVSATSSEALAAARSAEYRLAIVDFDLPDLREADLVRRLRSLQPNVLLMAMTSDPGVHLDDPLGVHATLPKPFYLPDLVDLVEKLLSTLPLTPAEAAGSPAVPAPHRLGDAAEAARLVAKGARDSGAYLVLLTRDGRRWVHAGAMPPSHVEQVVAKLRHYGIDTEAPGAVARYLRLPGASDAFFLYCLTLADVYLLAVLYPSRVPFGSVRRQAGRLAELFLQAPTPAAQAKPAPPM
ncbi:MAG: response regulator, partial [Chloroflexi bacterium]|nr:response regulator [Chloroflexota bacterium]